MVDDSPDGDQSCELCGADKKQHGTSVDLEIFYENYRYAGYPAFCSWEHAAAWFAQPRPDFTTWDKSGDRPRTIGDRVFAATFFLIVFAVLALAVTGAVALIR